MKKFRIYPLIVSSILACWFACSRAIVPMPKDAVDVSQKGEPYKKYWSVYVGAGRANEGLRASWLEQLQLVQSTCGFQYVCVWVDLPPVISCPMPVLTASAKIETVFRKPFPRPI